MKFQTKNSAGYWVDETDETRINMFLDLVLAREAWFAKRQNREPMTTRQQVKDFLATSQTIHYDNDWYAMVRDADALVKLSRPNIVELCGCGHSVVPNLVMSTSTGTSCPDCYDKMSG